METVLFDLATDPLTYIWVCAIIASAIYIRNMLDGAEVSSAMWLVYWVMGATLFFFYWALTCKAGNWRIGSPMVCSDGMGWSEEMWLLLFYAVVPGVYLAITLFKKGSWAFDPVEKLMLKLAGAVWVIWILITYLVETKSTVVAFVPMLSALPLLLAIPIDCFGTLTGMRHAHLHGSEYINRFSWLLTSIAVWLNFAILPSYESWAEIAYPLYLALAMPLFCIVVWVNTPAVVKVREQSDAIIAAIFHYKSHVKGRGTRQSYKPAPRAPRFVAAQ